MKLQCIQFLIIIYILQGLCSGFQNVLYAYENIARSIQLSGPTNFAPLINKAVEIVKNTRSVSNLSRNKSTK